MGAVFSVPIEVDVGIEAIVKRFLRWAVLDSKGENITASRFKEYDCYVFGNEARGVPAALASSAHEATFTIKGSGTMESLNVATAVNLSVYELCRS